MIGGWLTRLLNTVFQHPRRIIMATVCISFTVYLTLYRSNNWSATDGFLPTNTRPSPAVMSSNVKQETVNTNEKQDCLDLIATAKRVLDGEPIPLPLNGQNTLWKFKQRAPRELMKRNLVFGQGLNESLAEILKKRQDYNVSMSEIKGRKIFMTFGDRCCEFSKKRAVTKAKEVGGFDDARWYDLSVMPSKFRATHKDVLENRRGAGYWLWKPFILLKRLIEDMKDGDIVMYHDAGAYFIRSAAPLLKLCQDSKNGIMVFRLTHIEHVFTKQDAFILMNMSVPEAADSNQRLASYVVLRRSCTSIQFVMEWIAYLSDRRIASDDANTLGTSNPNSFRAHRHDQSVLSLLSKKWGLPAFRDPSQFGRSGTARDKYSSGPYEQIIAHDRNKQ